MKIAVKKLIRDEKGAAMVLALIMLLIGGLVSAPLLAYMGTGIVTGEVYEVKTAELYAADAGVEDAMWNIQLKTDKVQELTQCNQSTNYTITGVNGKTVDVTITLMTIWDGLPCDYRVVSRAVGDGSATEIDAYVTGESEYDNYSHLMDNAITSAGDINIQPGSIVSGDMLLPPEGELDPPDYEPENGEITWEEVAWPTADDLIKFYLGDVEGGTHYYEDTEIDLKGNSCPPGPIYINDEAVDCPSGLGPLYVDGELDILNSISTNSTLTLTGTIYITGDTLIGKNGKDMTLDLNGQTIFVASDSADPQKALEIGGQCIIEGPGVIIAIGDIYFAPKGDVGTPDEPVFVYSVEGTINFQPTGSFYGALAGDVTVDLQPNTTISYPTGAGWYEDLNFLIGVQQLIYSIYSWEVSQQ